MNTIDQEDSRDETIDKIRIEGESVAVSGSTFGGKDHTFGSPVADLPVSALQREDWRKLKIEIHQIDQASATGRGEKKKPSGNNLDNLLPHIKL